MTSVLQRSLPHRVSIGDINDPIMKQKVMLLIENINSLHAQLETAQRAILELQRRK